jgi:glutamine synthetase
MNIPEIFGCNVFDDSAMKSRLSRGVYEAMKRTIEDGRSLDLGIANEVAEAMKDWAVERGATHFTHWFQPMTGVTAEKHESFISPSANGKIIMEFSGRELVRGESDASSFPSGGLRATFEARGYTAWDPTSYAFIKDDTLYIPTAFCSYGGEALDKKTPLLRSMEALNRQCMRILRLFGDSSVTSVRPTVGAEQEYFLIDADLYAKRPDLIFTGRTLFGAKPPKGAELDDHYYGTIKPRVQAFMKDLDEELWKLGILAKTEHNEAAPAQHELAPVFIVANTATDQNQLTMEMMRKVARRHGLECLLHEKPFQGVSGSGKHNNWSINAVSGENLLKPGKTPRDNARFLLFLVAVVKAVDEYQDLLRLSAASAGNDHRLGKNEAPPAIVSIFLGDELTAILDSIESRSEYSAAAEEPLRLGVHVLPKLPRDTTDRNRTSPFAFTGNKFEFRMVGSSESLACTNIMLNTAVADALCSFADELEKAAPEDFNGALDALIRRTYSEHKRIIFNGNGYNEAWIAEAERRGLLNLASTPDAVVRMTDRKNLDLFARHKVYSEAEARSRRDIILDHYCKILNIEAQTMVYMTRRQYLPAVWKYEGELASSVNAKQAGAVPLPCRGQEQVLAKLSRLADTASSRCDRLEARLGKLRADSSGPDVRAFRFKDEIIPAMEALREAVDAAETVMPLDAWPVPDYGALLFCTK